SRIQIGIFITGAEAGLHAPLHFLVDTTDLRHAEGGNEGADQACAGQVDAFAESTAQHRKTNALSVRRESLQERIALAFGHAALLTPGWDVRVLRFELGGHLLQVVETAEEG